MIHRIWLDRIGWTDLEEGLQGCWVGLPWHGMSELMQRYEGSLFCLLSPDFFWVIRVPLHQVTQLGLFLHQNYGLMPGRWQWQVHPDHPNSALVLAMPNQIAFSLESIFLHSQARCTFLTIPRLATMPDLAFQVGFSGVTTKFGGQGLEGWSPTSDADRPMPESLLKEEWIIWCTGAETLLHTLILWRKRMWKVLAVTGLLLLGFTLWLHLQTLKLKMDVRNAQAFLEEHLEESQELQTLADRGSVAWEKLKEIQTFSKRQHPYSHKTLALAAGLPRGIKWTELKWEAHRFSVTLEGDQLQALLDYVDFIRSVQGTRLVSFEEFKLKHRTNQFVGKVQGEFP